MKKGRFLWSAHRITEKQKAGKARNIKEKQLKNSRSTVSKQLVEHLSSASDNRLLRLYQKVYDPGKSRLSGVFLHPNEQQKFDLIWKSILSILQTKNAYDIIPVGKKMKMSMRHAKTPVFQHRGFLFHLWQGGLYPRLATSCYFLSSHLQM